MESADLLRRNSETVYSFGKGHILFHQGLPCTGVFYVVKGTVKVFSTEDNGLELIHELLTQGSVAGLSCLFGNRPYAYSAEVLEAGQFVFLTTQDAHRLLRESPETQEIFLAAIGDSLHAAYDRNSQLIKLRVRERMAQCLRHLGEKFGTPEGQDIRIRLRLNREEFASVLGVAPETAIRFISEFKRRGLISEEGQQLILHDQSGLSRIISSEGS